MDAREKKSPNLILIRDGGRAVCGKYHRASRQARNQTINKRLLAMNTIKPAGCGGVSVLKDEDSSRAGKRGGGRRPGGI
jgi:hypothetical protein